METTEEIIKILKGNIVYTETCNSFEMVENGYIVVDGNYVEGVYKDLPDKYKHFNIKNYGDRLIIPGFIDLHTHGAQFAIRGIGYDKELLPWLETYTFPEEAKFSNKDYAEKVYREFVNELYTEGTTRAVIFGTIHQEATEILMELLEGKEIISYVGKVNMDRNCPDFLKENADESIRTTIQWIESCHNKYKFVKPIITPRFVPTCSDSLMKALGDIAINNSIPVQSHLSENTDEIKWVGELHPDCESYGAVYDKYNLFGKTKTIMAHCVHLTEEEISKIIKNQVFIAHCPSSNINLSSGISPISKLLKNNAPLGLGSDIAGGETLSMLSVMSCAVKVSKLRKVCYGEDEMSLTIPEVFYLATKGGGKFFGKVGSFEGGYEFDALVIDDDNLWKVRKGKIEERIERLIYLGSSKNIMSRYVFGKEV
ncbi:guanine deaminase [Clostridium cellulovorans]|uniref:Guanine deaminase n=1 Tax=Clostridium cellulovorans (strain ATCC 35296 / DSM 3052 / OCM 3 / 743B) TaxID=573061 RepID=D9SQI4_CLOC7|nr:guanine deaminase [Clostridium cellulovorans]ADL50251.1 Guanine deaminase [Clostridium cellulovorans 743B]